MTTWRQVEGMGNIVALRSTRGDVPGEGRIWDGACDCGEIGIVTDRQLIAQKSELRWGAKRTALHCGGPAHHPFGRALATMTGWVVGLFDTPVRRPRRA